MPHAIALTGTLQRITRYLVDGVKEMSIFVQLRSFKDGLGTEQCVRNTELIFCLV